MQMESFHWLSHHGIWAISKIQLVVYYQYCVLIGWATSRLFVIALVAKSAGFENQNNDFKLAKDVLSRYFFWPTSWILLKQLFLSPSWALSQ